MVNYQNGKIYKLVSFQTDKIYIGSTCEKLTVRKAKHKANYKLFLNEKQKYITSFEIVKYNDVDIILLEEFPCENKEQLHKRERYYIESVNNCVNKNIPTRTREERTEVNKDKRKEYMKEYRQENKDKNTEYVREYRKRNLKYFTCVCGSQLRLFDKARHLKTNKHIEATKPQ